MHASTRFARSAARSSAILLTVALTGCPAPTQMDAGMEELPPPADRVMDVQRTDRVIFDDTGDAIVVPEDTGRAMDATVDGDAGPPPFDAPNDTAAMMSLDVQQPDVPLPAQTCSWVASPTVFGAAGPAGRVVFVQSDLTGFAAGAAVLRDGATNVWVQRVSRDGAATLVGNISGAAAGLTVRGGSFVRDGMFLLTPWSQTEGADESVYIKRVQDNFGEVVGSRVRVTTAGTHQEPQLIVLRVGHMLVWRSVESGRGRVRVAPVMGSTIGAAMPITAVEEDVTSFRALSSQTADVYAVAYRDSAGGTIRVRVFDATGATRGAPVDVASGADLGASVDAAIEEDDGDAWVTWAQPATGGTIRLRRVGLATGSTSSPALDLATAAGSAEPGVAMDGADVAVAYRELGGSLSTVSLVRVRADGTVRDRSQLGAAAAGGRVGIAARDGRYGIGWSDENTSGPITRIGVASCR